MLLIPAALCFPFGRMVGDTRQGWALLGAMTVIFVVMAWVACGRNSGAIRARGLGVDQVRARCSPAATWRARSRASASRLRAVRRDHHLGFLRRGERAHDSLTPLGGLVPMWLMQLGEVVFGGVGSGLYGMMIFAIMAVFIAGLMIGRTPEYVGKKIESFEMKMTSDFQNSRNGY